MMRRLAAGVAAAALGASVLATAAAPAMAAEPTDPDFGGGSTSLQISADPNPVREGRKLHLGGKLSVQCDEDYINGFVSVHHADYCKDSEKWHRLGWKRIVILFQADGSHKWDYVDTLKTSRAGRFYTQVPAYTSGTFRAIFEGSRHLAPSEGRDWVKVVKH